MRTLSKGFTAVGSEEARLRASLRPPLKLHVRFSRMQLSRRLSDAGMQEKELSRSTEQARTRRKAWSQAAVSSPHCANAGTDATRCVAGSSRRDVGRVQSVCLENGLDDTVGEVVQIQRPANRIREHPARSILWLDGVEHDPKRLDDRNDPGVFLNSVCRTK